MRTAIIGRTEVLYDTALRLHEAGHQIACILTANEAPEYRKKAVDFAKLAKIWRIPFAQSGKITEHIEFLRKARADIGVSINYTSIVPQEVIDIFPLGLLNAHGGDLPRYRGNACQAWAILNGEDHIGLCIHRMIGNELDSGDIIARDYLPIDHNTKVGKVWDWITARAPELFAEALSRLEGDPSYILAKQSKDLRKPLRCYPRRPEDGRIKWNKPAIDILRLINASNKPYHGAYCNFEGKKIIIWDAKLVNDDENFCAAPGQVTKVGETFVEIACGVGKLKILSVESPEGVSDPTVFIKSVRKRLA